MNKGTGDSVVPHGSRGRKAALAGSLTTLVGIVVAALSTGAAELPLPEAPFAGKIAVSARDSAPDWPRPPQAPQGAPSILLILLDDVGFGASSAFGGPAQ